MNGKNDSEMESSPQDMTLDRVIEPEGELPCPKYESLLRNMHNGFLYFEAVRGISQKNQEFIVIDANQAFEVLTGFQREDLIGKKASELFPDDYKMAEQLMRSLRQVLEDGREMSVEAYHGAMGRFYSLSLYAPEERRIAVIMSDVTLSKQMENELERLKRISQKLLDDFPSPIRQTDRHGKCYYVNDAWLRMTGRPADKELGKGWMEVIHPDDKEEFIELLKKAFETEIPFEFEVRLLSANGDYIWTAQIGQPYYDLKDRFSGYIIACYDFTARKQYDDALQLVNKKLHLMGSVTRHDLMNQLTALSGYISLASQATKEANIKNYLDKSQTIAINIQKYLEFGRDYEKMGTTKPEWRKVEEAFYQGASGEQLGEVKITVELDGMEVYSDKMLEKVFHNLIDNALRHGGKVSKVHLYHAKTKDGMKLIFEDDGKGITPDKKDILFQDRYGRGLYLVKEILGITGMTIKEIGNEGSGARFEIHVPEGIYRFDKSESIA